MINKILNGLKAQNHKYIAKAISIIENKDSQSSELLNNIFPVISNLYWIYDRWSVTGDFLNFYTQINLIVLGMFIAFFGLYFIIISICKLNFIFD